MIETLLPETLKYRWLSRRAGTSASIFMRFFPPVAEGELISLDLETSSLDTQTAEILEIAAVPVRQGKVYPGEALVLRVKPDKALNPESVPIHQIRRKDLEYAMAPEDALEDLLMYIGRRPLLGYNIHFDQQILTRYCQQYFGFKLPNTVKELSHRYYRRMINTEPEAVTDLRLESICKNLKVPLLDRHTAKGDAVTVALAWSKM